MKKLEKTLTKFLTCTMLCMLWMFFLTMRTEAASVNYVPLATDNVWVSGSIDNKDETDFYTVHMPSAGWLTVGYQAFDIRDSYIEIKSDDLTKQYERRNIFYSSATSPITCSYEFALEKGDYSICIYGAGSNVGDYRVKASFKPAENNESESNNTFDTAMDIGLGSQVTGFLSIDDRIDFYKINVPYKKMVRLVYTARIPDSYLEIWNSEYVNIYKKNIYTAAEDKPIVHVFEQQLDAGTYYIKILPCGNNVGRYTLQSQEKIITRSIKISGKNNVVAGKSVKLSATLSPANVTDSTIQWSSGDTGIATVDQNGKVTTYKAGRVNITASAQDGSNVTKVFSLIVTPKKTAKPYAYNYSKAKLYVSWQTQSGVTGYEVQYSKKKNFSKSVTKTKKVSSNYSNRTFTGVKKGTYYVRVRAYLKVGKKVYNGDWSSVKKISIKR